MRGAGAATAVMLRPVVAAVLRVVGPLLSLSGCTMPLLVRAVLRTADLQVGPGAAVLGMSAAGFGLDLPCPGDMSAAAGVQGLTMLMAGRAACLPLLLIGVEAGSAPVLLLMVSKGDVSSICEGELAAKSPSGIGLAQSRWP